jgi:hypothetical protein
MKTMPKIASKLFEQPISILKGLTKGHAFLCLDILRPNKRGNENMKNINIYVQGVSKNWAHFVFLNFSASKAPRNKTKGIIKKLSPCTFKKCAKTYRSAKRCLRYSTR